MPLKSFPPKPIHQEVMKSFKDVLNKYKDELSGVEMLALASQLVGQLIAVQDQTVMTTAMALELVGSNIELGNATAVDELLGKSQGSS